jgi:hypothetical protein
VRDGATTLNWRSTNEDQEQGQGRRARLRPGQARLHLIHHNLLEEIPMKIKTKVKAGSRNCGPGQPVYV